MEVLSGYAFDSVVALIFFVIFLQSSDLVKKQVALYLFSFVFLVVASELFFGKEYSNKSASFITELEQVKNIIYLFSLTFFLLTIRIPAIKSFTVAPYKNSNVVSIALSLPIIACAIIYFSENGIRLSGEFLLYADDRNVWFDYVFVYAVCCLVVMRGSKIVALSAGLMAIAHLLSAERLRAFVYVMTFLILYYQVQDKRYQAALILGVGFSFATFIGLIRMGGVQLNDVYNVTHFGSVTVSSLFLMDEASYFDTIQRIQFFVGTIAANIVPSYLLPEPFDIRSYIFSAQNIPGGGWLPVFAFAIGGYMMVVGLGAMLGLSYRGIIGNSNAATETATQLAKYSALVIFVATVPRWLMYTPYQVLKMPLYGFIGTWLLAKVIRTFVKGNLVGQS